MDVQNKNITVLGAARSGIAAAKMLKTRGATVFVSDSGDLDQLKKGAHGLKKHAIEFELGQHSKRVFDCEMVALSPGIPVASEIVQNFYKKNIPVFSEIEVASWFNKSPMIAVTGSNGKTTTTTLIGEMIRKMDPEAIVAGNIGQPLSEFVDKSKPDRWGVVELSSFQLETIDRFRPKIAVVLNFAPNHLDRYLDYDAYLKAKWRITKNLHSDDILIYNADDAKLSEWVDQIDCKKLSFKVQAKNPEGAALENDKIYLLNEELIITDKILLKGVHNYMNAMAASLAASNANVSKDAICDVLESFKGVEHRLEPVAEIKGVSYINDSKATTVESLSYALQSYRNPIILIAGGKDKGSDFSKLNDLIKSRVKKLILIGSAAQKMWDTWSEFKVAYVAKSLEDAVKKAAESASKNDVVLLSPACASFDMFKDYEDRGRKFKEIVKNIELII